MRKCFKIIIPMVVVLAILAYGIYWGFFDIQRIKGQEILQEVSSHDDSNTVIVYVNNGGATTGYAVLCAVKNNQTGKERNIY